MRGSTHMARTKKTEEKIEETVSVEKETTNTELLQIIELYKVQSPAKYEQKKAELEAKLKR